MPIRVACQCGQQFAAPDHLAGQATPCPVCGRSLRIGAPPAPPPAPVSHPSPAAPTSVAVQCPRCHSQFAAPGHMAGQAASCPQCGSPILVGANRPAAVGSATADDLFEELTPVALEPALKSAEELRDERNRARKDQRRRLARRAKKAKSLGASLLMWLTTLAILVASINGIRVIVVLGIPILLPMIMEGFRTSSALLIHSLHLVILLASAIASLLGLLSVPLLLVRNPLGRSMAVAAVLGGFVSSLLSIVVISLAMDAPTVPNKVIYSFVVQGIMLFILLSQAAQRYFDDAD